MADVTVGAVLNRLYIVRKVVGQNEYEAEDRITGTQWRLRRHQIGKALSAGCMRLFCRAFVRLWPLADNGSSEDLFELPCNYFADDHGYFTVYAEPAGGGLASGLTGSGSWRSEDLGRFWCAVLAGLEKLHARKVCHGGLCASAFFSRNGGRLIVKNFAYFDLLSDPGTRNPEEVLDEIYQQNRGKDVRASAEAVLHLLAKSRGQEPAAPVTELNLVEDESLRKIFELVLNSDARTVPEARVIRQTLPTASPVVDQQQVSHKVMGAVAGVGGSFSSPVQVVEPLDESVEQVQPAIPEQQPVVVPHITDAVPRPRRFWPATAVVFLSILGAILWLRWPTSKDAGALAAPVIRSFRADQKSVAAGQPVTLSWSTAGATEVFLSTDDEPGKKSLPPNGSEQFYPSGSTRYTLHALAGGTSVTAGVDIEVRTPPAPTVPPLVIRYFRVRGKEGSEDGRVHVPAGTEITLEWRLDNARWMQISNTSIAGAPSAESTSVSPAEDTTYVLNAIGESGQRASREIHVAVHARPEVELRVTPTMILIGDRSPPPSVVVEWRTTGADRLRLDPEESFDASPGFSGSCRLYPSATMTIRLLAEGPGGRAEKEVTVTVDTRFYRPDPEYSKKKCEPL